MSFAGLLDHTCQLWRRTEEVGASREAVVSYAVPTGYETLSCAFTRRRSALVNDGSGLQPVGQRTLFLDRIDLTWQERDVVEIYEGPSLYAGSQFLEVMSISVPRGHHVELIVDEWDGELNTNPIITTSSPLPDAEIDVPYSVTLEATGGDGDYTWSIIGGGLPLGVTLDPDTGVISGITVFTGSYTFIVQVESAGATTPKDFLMLVGESPVVLGSFNLDFNTDFDVGG